MSGRFVRNTIAGKRRGSKHPPEVKMACLSEMLVKNNLHAIAQKHGVPESTLRTWWNEFRNQGVAGQAEVLADAQRQAANAIAYDAAAGARLAVEMMNLRLERADRNAERAEEIDAALLAEELDEETEARLKREKELRPPMGDYPLANFARVAMSVREKALQGSTQLEDDGDFAVEIRVVD